MTHSNGSDAKEKAREIVEKMKVYRYQIHTHECDADAAVNLIATALEATASGRDLPRGGLFKPQLSETLLNSSPPRHAPALPHKPVVSEAAKVLEFYADPRSWSPKRFDAIRRNVIGISDVDETNAGGRRAREFLKGKTK